MTQFKVWLILYVLLATFNLNTSYTYEVEENIENWVCYVENI